MYFDYRRRIASLIPSEYVNSRGRQYSVRFHLFLFLPSDQVYRLGTISPLPFLGIYTPGIVRTSLPATEVYAASYPHTAPPGAKIAFGRVIRTKHRLSQEKLQTISHLAMFVLPCTRHCAQRSLGENDPPPTTRN